VAIVESLLILVGVAFAINMGGSGLAPSFSVAMGSGLVTLRRAVLYYGVGVVVGAWVLGDRVAATLGRGIVPEQVLTIEAVLVVFASAALALFMANALKIPQSTSWVTVFSLVGLGLQQGELNTNTLFRKLLPAWLLLPLVAFALTYVSMRPLYPLTMSNMQRHAWLQRHAGAVRSVVVVTACYVAFAIGANNVANVAGPVAASGYLTVERALFFAAPLFAVGAWLLPGPARTVGKAIVPMGPLAASVVSAVVGSLLLLATWLGIPQSLVQLNAGAVLAVWKVKEQERGFAEHAVTRKMLLLWLVTPIIALLLTLVVSGFVVAPSPRARH
jgi:sulfate permease